MNKFLTAIQAATNVATTENGAVAFATTNSAVLDFFAAGGALRSRDAAEKMTLFSKAMSEDPLLALKALFYFRDIRGGQGERGTFRELLKYLAAKYPQHVTANIGAISEYGRWDDLYALFDTPLENQAKRMIAEQLLTDLDSDRPSLLAKWLHSENTSSKESKRLGRKTREFLRMTPRQYRKTLSTLRDKISVIESKISRGEWESINYEHVPSKAGLKYRKAFARHDGTRYNEYITSVAKGEKKINVKDLYPYEIVQNAWTATQSDVATLDAMWNNLPNYFGETNTRGIVVADVSGSMSGRPMDVSISLAIYCAERNKGPFHNKFITFSGRPTLQTVVGADIVEKATNLRRADWEMNTNIEAVFNLILKAANTNNLTNDDLPTHLYIVSDMEFDDATRKCGCATTDQKLFQTIKHKFDAAGLDMPMLVFWNVDSRNDQFPMSMDERGFQLVSGCSPSIFASLLSNQNVSAYDLMLDVLNGERYEPIVLG